MNNRIVVTGGSGLLGRLVVDRLTTAGATVRTISRHAKPENAQTEWAVADLNTGNGLRDAIADAEVVVHCATTAFARRAEVRLTENLVNAAKQSKKPHLVYISIVGVDRVHYPYYQGKLESERTIEQSGLPHTILRATQFHDLLRAVFARAVKLPVMPVPAIPDQPVDVTEVADRLAALALADPIGRAQDLGGPQVESLLDLARTYLRATGRNRRILPVRLPGKVFRAYRDGGHTCPGQATGTITFADYLSGHPAPLANAYRGGS